METTTELERENDGVLIGRIVNGDHDAAAVLIRRHQKSLLTFLRRVAPQNADDLFQETWIKTIRSAARFDPSYPFPPWLFRIAWNLVRSEWRRRDLHSMPDSIEIETAGSGAEDDLVSVERGARVRLLIDELPPHLAEALFLRYFEELSEKEMAERLGVPKGTIKSRLHHALRRLAPAVTREFS